MMLKIFLKMISLCGFVAFSGMALAEERKSLGWSLAISNDSLGDQYDRWQSSSFQIGVFQGYGWNGRPPEDFGSLLEYRIRADHLTPESLSAPLASDRPHAGVLSFGVYTHAMRGKWELSVGADLLAIGPQTGLLNLQEELHEILGFEIPQLDNFQIEDQFRVNLTAEVGRSWDFRNGSVRPFVEVAIGPEDFIRSGVDLTFGKLGRNDLLVRTQATGHRVSGIRGAGQDATTFVFGFDTAWVNKSVYLPEALGYELTPLRTRVRAGVHYDWKKLGIFYGIAWLEPEFEAQPEGQFVGTLRVGWDF